MHSRKTVPIPDLMSAANMELIRLDFKSSTLSRHSKEFRSFSNYCRENEITAYDAETGPQYFQHCYGLDIGNSTAKLILCQEKVQIKNDFFPSCQHT